MAKFKIETEIESENNIGDIIMFDQSIDGFFEYDQALDNMNARNIKMGIIIGVGLYNNEIEYNVLVPNHNNTLEQIDHIKDYHIINYTMFKTLEEMIKIANDCMISPEELDKIQYEGLYNNETNQRINV